MIRKLTILATSILLLGFAHGSLAQEANLDLVDQAASDEEKDVGWSGAITASYYERRGNSTEQNWGLELKWAYQTEGKWLFDGLVSGMSNSTDNSTTDEKYRVENAAKYFFDKKSYGVGRAIYEKDRFSGIEEEAGLTGGYGRELLSRGDHRLIGEAGAGLLWTQDSQGSSDTGGVGYGALMYTWELTEHSSFSQLLVARYSEADSNWRLRSVSEVKATIIGSLSGKFTYEIKRNSEVPDGDANSDFYTTLGLEYAF